LKDGYFVAISDARVNQKTKCQRTVNFNTSSHILRLIGQLRNLQYIRRQKSNILAAKYIKGYNFKAQPPWRHLLKR